MEPSASKAFGLSWPILTFAGVCVAPDIPPEPCGFTLYFSDILTIEVVKSLGVCVRVQINGERLGVRLTENKILMSEFGPGL